ncbi:MAG: MauE/DoxX family redox-associated membrane protein [Candidatus Brachytrichaceae bacterium NZ_4S206]|jgi:uncharacterized membrane protein YphA (DoxX/SURF4 family)
MDIETMQVALMVGRIFLGVIFLTSVIGKLLNWRSYVQSVANYEIVRGWAAKLVAVMLPLIEAVVAVMLLSGAGLQIASVIAAALLIGFIGALTVNLRRERLIECGCYGIVGSRTISWGTVIRNLILLLTALLVSFAAIRMGSKALTWQEDLRILTQWTSPVLLLTGFCFAVTSLIAWTVDIHQKVAALRGRLRVGG